MKFSISSIQNLYDQAVTDSTELSADELQKKYLKKGGELTDLLRSIGGLEPQQRGIFGKEANQLKNYIQEIIDQKDSGTNIKLSATKPIDASAPFDINTPQNLRPSTSNKAGSQHPLTKELEYILELFQSMGFNVEESRQLDNDYNMFGALNFPEGHPARDIWDTFWTDENLIPPAHTSTMQNRVLRKYDSPIRVVIPGRCYRNEATDASHEHTLHQIEGVYVDKNISVGDMIGTIKTYLEAFFETELKVKVQPAFFPFTEPDMEFLISCPFCKQTGCGTCGNTGWMEIMGCGMIHPNVLKEAGIDPEVYTGFAWGFGLDRLVMIKNSIQDIRWLHSGHTDFLKQF